MDSRDITGALPEPSILLENLANRVIGAAIHVHRALGPGFAESIYEEALAIELHLNGIAFERQVSTTITYRGFEVGTGRVDMVVDQALVVELKAVEQFASVHIVQVISYLKALDLRLGLLINFNVTLLKNGIRRIVNSRPEK